MKRLLFGWRDGTFRNSDTKWPARTTLQISEFLLTCKMPSEIHRAVRGLDCLAHWKGTEYRTFLHYVGIIALKEHLPVDVYEHFLVLFCAVTICSSKQYFCLLPAAEIMFNHYIEGFREIYGEQYMTSNIHNLTHLIDDVRRFGELDSFSAYPFESLLCRIKKLLRNGKRPLVQAAKRIAEQSKFESANISPSNEPSEVVFTKQNEGKNVPAKFKLEEKCKKSTIIFYSKIKFEGFLLSTTDTANKWFLSRNNEIVGIKNILLLENTVVRIFGSILQGKYDFFKTPFPSSELDIFAVDCLDEKNSIDQLFNVLDIKCKLVRVECGGTAVFIPLLHTNTT